MKSILIFRFSLILVSLIVLMGCSDSVNDSGQKVDGVNVSTGKRLTELQYIYGDSLSTLPHEYKVEYDNKGRLNKIICKEIDYIYERGTKKCFIQVNIMK